MLIQTGSKIPDGQLCLTFDDGPGPNTADISSYLRSQQISATFFLIGKHVSASGGIVQQVVQDGHEIGNHTQTHPWLRAEIVHSEIAAAHEELRTFVVSRKAPLFFRPPYGSWPTVPGLNNLTTHHGERLGDLYAGPVSWDFNGDDWWYWENAANADDLRALSNATARYAQAQRGIILMHDYSPEPKIARQNQTNRMVKALVPTWKAQGRSFISLRDAYQAGFLDIAM